MHKHNEQRSHWWWQQHDTRSKNCLGRLRGTCVVTMTAVIVEDPDNNADGSRQVLLSIKTIAQAHHCVQRSNHRSQRVWELPAKKNLEIPFVLEHTNWLIVDITDEATTEGLLRFHIRVDSVTNPNSNHMDLIQRALTNKLLSLMFQQFKTTLTRRECFGCIATLVLQCRLRGQIWRFRCTSHLIANCLHWYHLQFYFDRVFLLLVEVVEKIVALLQLSYSFVFRQTSVFLHSFLLRFRCLASCCSKGCLGVLLACLSLFMLLFDYV